jgi:ParB family chromosome partitioning protein
MAKLPKSTGEKKADLEDIILIENVRKEYTEIEQRARSIERDGLLSPVIVSKDMKLIAGYCRYYAHKLLVDEGKPYNQIEYIVRSGDTEILQLTENIQRSNLSHKEIESALRKMSDRGMKQTEIAARINKPKQWVSDHLKAEEIREKIEKSGIDTTEIPSSAIQVLRSVPENELPTVAQKVKENGGTVAAAKNEVKKDPFDRIRKEAVRLKKAGYDYQEIIEEIGEAIL